MTIKKMRLIILIFAIFFTNTLHCQSGISKGGSVYVINGFNIGWVPSIDLSSTSWYGVSGLELSDPALSRIGNNSSLHASLPVHELMKACLLNDDGTVNYYLHPSNWDYQTDSSTASNLDGTDGQVMIEIPEHWVLDWIDDGEQKTAISLDSIRGFKKIYKQYVSAYLASINRTTLQLASVRNTTANYRGGNNDDSFDGTVKTVLGKPVSSITYDKLRDYARARNNWDDARWNMNTWYYVTTLQRLFMVEYATKNSQLPLTSELTMDGYKMGGLGNGFTTVDQTPHFAWNTWNPLVPNGYTDTLFASGTGERQIIVPFDTPDTAMVNRYRGIENPFGGLWQFTDGLIFYIDSTDDNAYGYVYDNPAEYYSWSTDSGTPIGSVGLKSDAGKITSITNYHHKPTVDVGNLNFTTHFADYKWPTGTEANDEHPYTNPRWGGYPYRMAGQVDSTGGNAGLFCLKSDNPGYTTTPYIGTRLTYTTIDMPAHTATGLNAEYDSVYQDFILPPVDSIALFQSEMVDSFQASGYWDSCSGIYLIANHTQRNQEALTNWKNPSQFATQILANKDRDLIFTEYEGFTGESDKWINIGDFSDYPKYQINNAHILIVVFKDTIPPTSYDIGVNDGTNHAYVRVTDGGYFFGTLYSTSYGAKINTSAEGYYTLTGNTDNQINFYKNKDNLGIGYPVTSAIPTGDIYLMARNNNGTESGFATGRQFAFVSIGAYLSENQIERTVDAIEKYLDNINKGILP